MLPDDGHIQPDWNRPIDPEKKKLQRRLDTIEGVIILLLVIVLLLFGGDLNLGLILIVLGLIVVGIIVRAMIKTLSTVQPFQTKEPK